MKTLGIKLAWFWAAAFILAGISGFIPNPLTGPGSLFATNTAHNLVHIISGIGFIIVAMLGNSISISFLKGFGAVYILIGLVSFLITMNNSYGMLLGFIHINTADNFLHMALGIGIIFSGYKAKTNSTRTIKRKSIDTYPITTGS